MSEDKRLPLRLPYGQRYNPESDRLDSSESKGIGFKGPIKQDDHIVSEYSADRDIQYPSIYEGITPADLAAVMMAERLQRGTPRDVDQRAYDAAQRRVKEGRSPFFEQGRDKYPKWSPDQEWERPAIMRAEGGTVMDDEVSKALRLARDDEPKYDTGPKPGEATLRAYEPTWKERFQNYLMGTDTAKPSPERRRFAEGMTDILSAAPGVSNVLAGERLASAMEAEDLPAAGAAALGMIPGASGYVGRRALDVARNRLTTPVVEEALRLTRGSGGRSDKKATGSVEPAPDYMRPFNELSPEKKAEVLRHRFNSFSPKTGPSATTPRNLPTPKTPKLTIDPEEYRRGNMSAGQYSLATGGSARRRGYALGGNPTDPVAGTNPQTPAAPSPYSSYVGSLYNNILGRQADPGGQQYWEGQLGKGLTTTQDMLSNFAGSKEYQNLYKTDPTKAVAGMYQAALSRTPEQAGLEYWTGQAKQGLDANKLASQFAGTPEFQNRNAIFNSYLNYTGEAPKPEQYASASQALASGKTLGDVEQQIASSPQANANFVRSAYQGLLGQTPDQSQVQRLTDQLSRGELTQQNLLNMLASSSQGAEYANEQTLLNAFKGAMNRAPTQAEQDYYLPQMAQNKITQDQLFQAVRNTPEAQDYSNTRLVKDTFKALTGQTPDQATLQKYVDQITSGELDSGKLWSQLEATPEAQKWAANTPKGSFDDVIGRFGQYAENLTGLGKEAATKVGGLWDQIVQANPDLAGSLPALLGLESGPKGLIAAAEKTTAAGLGQQTKPYIVDQINRLFGTQYTTANLPSDIQKAITSTDPSSQALSLASFLQGTLSHIQVLQKNGIPVNEKTVYALHNLGDKGGMAFLNTLEKNPNATMGSIAKAIGGGSYNAGIEAIRINSKLYPQGASTKIGDAFDNFQRLLDPKQTPKHQEWGTNVINQLGEIADKAKPAPAEATPPTTPGGTTPDPGKQGTLNLPEYDKAVEQYQSAYNDWKQKSDLYLVQEMSYGNKNPQLPSWWPAPPAQPNKGQFAKDAYEKAVKDYKTALTMHNMEQSTQQMIAQQNGWYYSPVSFKQEPPNPANYGFEYNADNKNWSFTGTLPPPPPGGNLGQQLAGQGAGGNVAGTGGGGFGGVQPGVIPGVTGNADLAASLAQQSAAQQAQYLAQANALAKGFQNQADAVAGGYMGASATALQNYLTATGSQGLSYLMGFSSTPPADRFGNTVLPPSGFGVSYGGGGGGYGGTGSVTYGGGGSSGVGSGGFGLAYMNKGGVVGKALRIAKAQGGRLRMADGGAPQNDFVSQAYQQYLGRAPDAGGHQFWQQQAQSGMGQQAITDAIRNSQEAQQRRPQAVTQAYEDYLGRAPDQAGQDYWSGQLQGGALGIGDLGRAFSASPEAQQYAGNLSNAYQLAYGQAPKAAEDAMNWARSYRESNPTVLAQDKPFTPPTSYTPDLAAWKPNIPASNISTPSFNPPLNPVQPTAQPSTPPSSGSPTTPSSGDKGTTYDKAVPSWQPNVPAPNMETPSIGQQLDPIQKPDIPTWNPKIPNSTMDTPSIAPPLEQLRAGEIKIDPKDYGNFVTSLFSQYLNRAPEQAAQDFFASHLAQGSSPADVATAIATSPEAQAGQVGSMYQYMLGRQADPEGLKYYQDQIAQGKMDINDVGESLMSSPEYADYQNQLFETNKSGFTPVGQYDFGATALPDGLGEVTAMPNGYLDSRVWAPNDGTNDVFPTSFASTVLSKGLGPNQQMPAGYIDPNVMLANRNNISDKFQFAVTALQDGLGENGAFKPYVDASINAQKVNEAINNIDPKDYGSFVTQINKDLTGKAMDPGQVRSLSDQLNAGKITPQEVATQIAKQANVPLPPPRPDNLSSGSLIGDLTAGAKNLATRAYNNFVGMASAVAERAAQALKPNAKADPKFDYDKRIAIEREANKLGIPPEDLAKVMLFESIGSLNPNRKGVVDTRGGSAAAVRKGAIPRFFGLIQFGPNEQLQYGVKKDMTFSEQMESVGKYLEDRGLKTWLERHPNATAEEKRTALYSTINAGGPDEKNWGKTDARYGGSRTTVRQKVAQMDRDWGDRAQQLVKAEPVVAEDRPEAPLPPDRPENLEGMITTPEELGFSGGTPPAGIGITSGGGDFGGSSGGTDAGAGAGATGGSSGSGSTGSHGGTSSHGGASHPVTHTGGISHSPVHTGSSSGSFSVGYSSDPYFGHAGVGGSGGIGSGSHTSGADPYFGHSSGSYNSSWAEHDRNRGMYGSDSELDAMKKHGGRVTRAEGGIVDHALRLAAGGGAWTRKEGQNPNGGLNAKGRASAKAEGHNLKPPAPHPKTEKDAARRKSFCSRMQGMKSKLTSSETANDPDSRINKSLRAWNCREEGGAIQDALDLANRKLHRRGYDDGGDVAPEEGDIVQTDTTPVEASEAPAEESPAEEIPVEEAPVEEAPVEELLAEEAPKEKADPVADLEPWQKEFVNNGITRSYADRLGREPTEEERQKELATAAAFGTDVPAFRSARGALEDRLRGSDEAQKHALQVAENALNWYYYGNEGPSDKQGQDFWNKWAQSENKDLKAYTQEDVKRIAATGSNDRFNIDRMILSDPNYQKWHDYRQDWLRPDPSMQKYSHSPEARDLWAQVNSSTEPQQQPQQQPQRQAYNYYYYPYNYGLNNPWARRQNQMSPNYDFSQPYQNQYGQTQPQPQGFGAPQPQGFGSFGRPFKNGGAVKKALDTALEASHPKRLHHTLAQTGYAEGGEVWDKPRPKSLGKSKKLSSSQKSSAKAAAKAAGRPWPNLVDNMRAAQRKK